MKNKRKGFWEYFIEDAINNPPYYTTAKVTDIDTDNHEIHITFLDENGILKTAKLKVNTMKYAEGDKLDIQVCGGIFPAIFFC